MRDHRADELTAAVQRVRRRIAGACADAGREPASVTLVVVTKFFPAEDVGRLARLGIADFGENRHQEAEAKVRECGELDVRWHFVGGLQSNKAAAVAGYADVVESVDRTKVVAGLDRGAAERGRVIDVLLQVSLDGPDATHRSGAPRDRLADLAATVTGAEHLRLAGLMAVAPLGEDADTAFRRLAEIRAEFLEDHPTADVLSAGMSGDLEEAIRHGATHVRVGSAILGPRPGIQ